VHYSDYQPDIYDITTLVLSSIHKHFADIWKKKKDTVCNAESPSSFENLINGMNVDRTVDD
jgi:hypothetical protein